MKKLTPDEITNLTLEKAWVIVFEFSDLIADSNIGSYEFTDKLPYRKNVIELAFIKIFKDEDFEAFAKKRETSAQGIKDTLANAMVFLDSFIPNEVEYASIVGTKKLTDEIKQKGAKSMLDDILKSSGQK